MHEVVRKTLQIYLRERINCKKENTLYECVDLALACLTDPRFAENLKNPDLLDQINIRVDTFAPSSRRILRNISELNVRDEGIIFLSQNLGKLSVILPNMIKENPTSEAYFELAKQKAGISAELTNADYVIYALKTTVSSDF